MAIHQIKRVEEYLRLVQHTPAEAEALFRDLLIGVTSFFRDLKVFAVLEEQAIRRLVSGAPAGAWIRVWVPGCSTGEEAYSIAILFQEQSEALRQNCRVQIFATDIDRQAIEQARAGVYPASVASDISPQRLARFFTQEQDGRAFRMHKSIRDMLVFSEQDVIKDPPFSKLDLISCRNLLIYMSGELQKKLIPLFHYSLNPGGMLLLGTSETVGDFVDLFSTMDRTSKLYQKKTDLPGAYQRSVERFVPPAPLTAAPLAPGLRGAAEKLPLRELTEKALLQRYSPAAALVDARGNILYLHGRTGRFLELAPGEPGTNILKMAREGLRSVLGAALRQAAAANEPVKYTGVRIRTNGSSVTVALMVGPVPTEPRAAGQPGLLLVTIEETPDADQIPPEIAGATGTHGEVAEHPGDIDGRIAALENELKAKEEYLQAANEELETSNEELTSSNEEMQSVNEELQSTNEELKTSKEELQAANEELATVNAELQTKVADLSRANNDMVNLLAGRGIATIFVDHQFRILRFTPTVTQIINLIQTDVGRPVDHIVSNLTGYDRLVADVQSVLGSLEPKEIEVQTKAGAWYLLRIRPYRTLENVIEGAVITFTEITETRKAQERMRESETLRRLAVVVRDANDAVTVQDLEGRILAWNPAAVKAYGWTEVEALEMNIRDITPRDRLHEALSALNRIRQAEVLEPYHMQRIARDGRVVDISLTATALVDESGKV
ncbi:MAG: CheR family methyltransferase [Spirochaetia bacterium]|jgi:two-component system CheB/CheR fusion protein